MRPCSTTLRSYANFEECYLRASETWSEVMIQHSLQHSFGRETNKVARYWCSARMAPLFFAFLAGQCVVLCRIEEIRIGCYSTEKQKVW